MAGYVTALAKVTSTAVVVYSFYLLNEIRAKRRRMNSSGHINRESSPDTRLPPLSATHIAESFTYPSATSTDGISARNLLSHGRSYLRHGWQFVSGLFHSHVNTANERDSRLPDPVKKILSSFAIDEMTAYHALASELAKEAKINPAVRGLLSTGRRKRFRRSNNSLESMFNSLLTALSSFTKDDLFLTLLLSNEEFCGIIERIAAALVDALPLGKLQITQPTQSSPKREDRAGPSGEFLDRMAMSDEPVCVDWPSTYLTQSVDEYPEYPYHLRLVQILANISRNPQSQVLLRCAAIQRLLSVWSESPSLHLTLLSQKVCENLRTHLKRLTESLSPGIVYYPDVFRLDRPDPFSDESNYSFDIVFIHGMRGSVFYTWRQRDPIVDGQGHETPLSTKCWPRDWLSREFPGARVLAIDASLNPFIWDPICPVDKFERTIDTRARKILPQLHAAGIGQRPIIWITHSAGGILVKELLRMSCLPTIEQVPSSSETNGSPKKSQSAIFSLDIIDNFRVTGDESPASPWYFQSDDENLRSNSPPPQPEKNNDRLTVHDASAATSSIPEEDSDLTRATAGIVFMSAPHRGNQSLLGLYRRPLRWTLTPEAIQLERNSSFLLGLHSWFHHWASRQKLPILSMVETKETPLNRFWSVLLVPGDEEDRELGHVVHIDSDHTYISKPNDPDDPSYTHIVNFIRDLREPTENVGNQKTTM